jgi:hypothetical protein
MKNNIKRICPELAARHEFIAHLEKISSIYQTENSNCPALETVSCLLGKISKIDRELIDSKLDFEDFDHIPEKFISTRLVPTLITLLHSLQMLSALNRSAAFEEMKSIKRETLN